LALRLAREGWALGILARNERALQELADQILDAGARVQVLKADVTDRAAVHGAVRELERALGPVRLLVANAGVKEDADRSMGGVDAEVLEWTLRVNLMGAVHCAEAVLPAMRTRRQGQLVVISSLAAYGGLPHSASYSASKAALSSYFEAKRIELRGSGVDVTVISPGYIRTPMLGGAEVTRPFLMEVDDAVERTYRAIRRRRRAHAFPLPLAWAVRVGRLLPRALYDLLLGDRRR